jgi:peptidylprolyl isomerase
LIKDDVVVGKPTPFNPGMKPVEAGDTVWVTYTGTFKDGKVFDTNEKSQKPDAKPYQVLVGAGTVIQGWEKGLIGMLPGGVRKLSVPWKLGYKEAGNPPKIPPYTDLYFEIKLNDCAKPGEETTYGIHDIKKGTGAVVGPKSTCTVHTTVREVDGKVIDDTKTMGQKKPATFTIGKEQTLPSIEDAVQGMRVGGIRDIQLPPAIAFPPSSETGISGTMMYYVRVELLAVK